MDMIKSNIENLTSLWILGGETCGEYSSDDIIHTSRVAHSEWPNKIWLKQPLDKQFLSQLFTRWDLEIMGISVWGAHLNHTTRLLLSSGLSQKNQLVGMSRELAEIPKAMSRIRLSKVQNARTATLWSELFHVAFGYHIHASVVVATMHAFDYFIGSSQDEYIGTAALYITDDTIAGIHSLGVIPKQRRKGYAEDFLLQVMHMAKNKGAEYATLQASEMGKGLYLNTGFQEDFLIRNFIQITKTENK